MRSVEARNKEKQVSKGWWAILIFGQVGSEYRFDCSGYGIRYLHSLFGAVNKVRPFPSLAAKESDTAQNCPEHVFLNRRAIHAVASLNGQYHCYAAKDENKGHQAHKYQW